MTDRQPYIEITRERCLEAWEECGRPSANSISKDGAGRATTEFAIGRGPAEETRPTPIKNALALADSLMVNVSELTDRWRFDDFVFKFRNQLSFTESMLEDDAGVELPSLRRDLVRQSTLSELKFQWGRGLNVMGILGLEAKIASEPDIQKRQMLSFFLEYPELLHQIRFISTVDDTLLQDQAEPLMRFESVARNPAQYNLRATPQMQANSIEALINRSSENIKVRDGIPENLVFGDVLRVMHYRRRTTASVGITINTAVDDYESGDYQLGSRYEDYSFPELPVIFDVYLIAPVETDYGLLHTQAFPTLNYNFFSDFGLDGSPAPLGFTYSCKKMGQKYLLYQRDLDKIADYQDDYS